jgi:hypothetical protein
MTGTGALGHHEITGILVQSSIRKSGSPFHGQPWSIGHIADGDIRSAGS